MKRVVGVSVLVVCVALLVVSIAVKRPGAQAVASAGTQESQPKKTEAKARKDLERDAMCAKTAEEFQQKCAALAATGKPYEWEAAFKIALAGQIANPGELAAVQHCLVLLSRLVQHRSAQYEGSWLQGRLLQMRAAMPASALGPCDGREAAKKMDRLAAKSDGENYDERMAGRRLQEEAMAAGTAEEFQQKCAALAATGNPCVWQSAFNIAQAGVIANADEFSTVARCLLHFDRFAQKYNTTTRQPSYLRDRLVQLEVAVPVSAPWLYDPRGLWKRLVWIKAKAGDESHMEVLANAAEKGVMMNNYADVVFAFGKAKTVEDFAQIKALCQSILDSPGILGSSGPNEEYALFSTVLAMQACKNQARLSAPADAGTYLNEAKQWAQRVKNFGESAFDKEAQALLGEGEGQ